MATHDGGDAVPISRQYAVKDLLVFRQGARHALAHAQLQASIWAQSSGQLQGLLFQERVATAVVDRLMESLVAFEVDLFIPSLAGLLAGSVQLSECRPARLVHATRGRPGTQGLEFGHQLEHLLKADRVDFSYHGTASWPEFHDSLGGKLNQCFARGRAGHAVFPRQAEFIERAAWRKLPGRNLLFKDVA